MNLNNRTKNIIRKMIIQEMRSSGSGHHNQKISPPPEEIYLLGRDYPQDIPGELDDDKIAPMPDEIDMSHTFYRAGERPGEELAPMPPEIDLSHLGLDIPGELDDDDLPEIPFRVDENRIKRLVRRAIRENLGL